MLTIRQGLSFTAIERLIAQQVVDVMAVYEENRSNGNATQNKVNFATCTLLDDALTWWNSHVWAVGIDEAYEMSWKDLMKLIIKVYCSRNEIHKLESELWNLSMKGTDVAGYTRRFHELSLLCPRMVPDEEDKTKRDADNKRKWRDEQEGNHHQQQNKRQEVGKVYVVGTGNKAAYVGTLPLCDKCKLHHHILCIVTCGNYKKVGHEARDCWTPTSVTCYGYGGKRHTKRYYPRSENQNRDEEARQNLDIVTGTFLLENRYIPILTNASANRSFVFTAISHLSDVT
nr:hypothetical protein [Tanacetum cinerariifolium]